jgi:hypothetical protein
VCRITGEDEITSPGSSESQGPQRRHASPSGSSPCCAGQVGVAGSTFLDTLRRKWVWLGTVGFMRFPEVELGEWGRHARSSECSVCRVATKGTLRAVIHAIRHR